MQYFSQHLLIIIQYFFTSLIYNNISLYKNIFANIYPCERYIMPTIINPRTPAEGRCNRTHTRTGVDIQQTFGILKLSFRYLHHSGSTLQYSPGKCSTIISACLALHKYYGKRRMPAPYEVVESEGEMGTKNRRAGYRPWHMK